MTQKTGADYLVPNPMRERVRDELHRMITSQELKPGERIVETHWAEKLGVSKAPIREAIRELEVLDLIETIPYRGSFVKKLTALDVAHVSKVRGSLEATAAELAVEFVTDEQLDEFEELFNSMSVAASSNYDEEQYYQLDLKFHETIVIWSNNSVLYRFWKMLNVDQWSRLATKFGHKNINDYHDNHSEVCKALRMRDGKRAAAAITAHFEHISEDSMREYARTRDI